MKKVLKKLAIAAFAVIALASCTSYNNTMKTPNNYVEFDKDDFEFSAQVEGNATTTRIVGIDFSRLFTKKMGNISEATMLPSLASIPVIGNLIADKTANYALYEMMAANAGYDVVFYPVYEVKKSAPILGLPIYTITEVKVRARLAKIK